MLSVILMSSTERQITFLLNSKFFDGCTSCICLERYKTEYKCMNATFRAAGDEDDFTIWIVDGIYYDTNLCYAHKNSNWKIS